MVRTLCVALTITLRLMPTKHVGSPVHSMRKYNTVQGGISRNYKNLMTQQSSSSDLAWRLTG
jgi:hypothetical protein